MDEKQDKTEISSFKEKVAHEKQKFWDMEAKKEIVSTGSGGEVKIDKPKLQKNSKAGNIVLFVITLLISIAIFAYIFFVFIG